MSLIGRTIPAPVGARRWPSAQTCRAGVPFSIPARRTVRILTAIVCGVLMLLNVTGCRTSPAPKPGRTKLSSELIEVPAQLIGNLLVVETQWDKGGPWRFLVDTGSSATLVSPAFAARYATAETARGMPAVRVRGADGNVTTLGAVTLRRIELGDARFERVRALVFDCAELSAHLGMRIDGVLGFPLFRETVLTLDYPQSRLLLTSAGQPPLVPGTPLQFDATAKVPLIPLGLGDRTFFALIDSGSDGPLSLNPAGMQLRFANGPRPGTIVGTLAGDRQQQIGRLQDTLRLGIYRLPQPVVDLTENLSSIGGEVLRHFSVSFDQIRGTATFHRSATTPIRSPERRSIGIGFSRTAAYWRIVGLVPDSPASRAGLQPGDLVVRIDGEPVEHWPLDRYRMLIENTDEVELTLLDGRTERTLRLPTFVLVP